MANHHLSHPLNAPGPLYVDTTCIDCGTCFHLGPELFHEEGEASIVEAQPQSLAQWGQAKAAILSCPTNSIGVKSPPAEFRQAQENLPQLIDDNIYYCGYTARSSFGASSYLIRRPEGNILVDCPKFHPHLVKKLEELGGVAWIFLTHRDDVADHSQYAQHFKASRIIHKLEVSADTSACEMILEGEGDWELNNESKVIFTPGHTRGHLCLLYKNKFLFSGDHLFYSQDEDKVYASQNVSWYSWEIQEQSIKKLMQYKFDWLMPGHGGWIHKDHESILQDLKKMS
ncbi:MAG: MBL fold metallo-hydrolase [Bdellovibrionales bacterium]|nr:MBL fold metallo-hydrolase [Bdellovibrionales bacterium]